MGKPTGFIEWQRLLGPRRPVDDRRQDFREFDALPTPELARRQAGRCMDCGVPFCQQGCPLGTPIPEFNDLVYRDQYETAYRVLASTNNFPEFTGRLCPAPCEAACTLSVNQDPVTIEQIEKTIVERAFAEGWVQPEIPESRTGRQVAVVGSGPAGLAAAQQLNRAGHQVVVFERDDRIGGLLRYGIPDFKMERGVLDRRLEILHAEGVEFRPGVAVGDSSMSYQRLRDEYDAVLLALGSRRPRDLGVDGRDRVRSGVVFAMDFLEQQNREVAGDKLDGATRILATGQKVVILGGGDTGSDCLGTCHRQGAAEVRQVELFPTPPEARDDENPWPQWPLVFRTSSSQEEGGDRDFGFLTKRLEADEAGRLTALVGVRVDVEGGRLVEQPETEERIEVDLLLLAMGFVGPDTTALVEQVGITLDRRGNIQTDPGGFKTSVEGVYAAGDARRGQSLIVWAISEGREAARAIDADLMARPSSPLPTRGADQPFGGR
ncbi:MAG: glutamate synthase subunit beta [Myxococcota bacterium]